jgi:Fur family ferric uptake transcriptional regulator
VLPFLVKIFREVIGLDNQERIKDRLRDEGHFITEPRETIIEYFTSNGEAATADEIVEDLHADDHDIDRSSIYRTINLFTELGIVDNVLFRDGVKRVELADEFGGSHHHHLICDECGDVIEFEECGIDNLQRIAEIKHDFDVENHHMEFYGTCSECRVETQETATKA